MTARPSGASVNAKDYMRDPPTRQRVRYSGINTFFKLPLELDTESNYDIGLFGVPYDGTVSYRSGTRFGPSRLRELSSLGRGFSPWIGAEWTPLAIVDLSDAPIEPYSSEKSHRQIQEFCTPIVEAGRKFIAVGGEHSISLPLLRAAAARHGPLRLLHFDAHLDTYPHGYSGVVHHGSFLRQVLDEGLVDPGSSALVGVRGPFGSPADLDFLRSFGMQVVSVSDIRFGDLRSVLATSIAREGEVPTYLTFDIDTLDPAFAPGTGSPLPGGLTTFEVRVLLSQLACCNIVGADLVEVCPPHDHSDLASIAGVDIISQILALMTPSVLNQK